LIAKTRWCRDFCRDTVSWPCKIWLNRRWSRRGDPGVFWRKRHLISRDNQKASRPSVVPRKEPSHTGKVFARDACCRHSRIVIRSCCKSLRQIVVLLELLLHTVRTFQSSCPPRDLNNLHRLRCVGRRASIGTLAIEAAIGRWTGVGSMRAWSVRMHMSCASNVCAFYHWWKSSGRAGL